MKQRDWNNKDIENVTGLSQGMVPIRHFFREERQYRHSALSPKKFELVDQHLSQPNSVVVRINSAMSGNG